MFGTRPSICATEGRMPRDLEPVIQRALVEDTKLAPTGAAFTHYLFEAYHRIGRPDLIWQRLEPWRWALSQGFRTFPEYIDFTTRSDCHAWSTHPLHHYFASFLGIRPGDWGF